MDEDLQHIRLLSIFHYVVGGLAALVACFPFLHFFVGLAMLFGWFDESDPALAAMGLFFSIFAGVMIVLGWAFAVCLVIAGRRLAAHRSYTYCLVMAGVACMFMPFGTVLGVLTIVVLMRPSVKALFAGTETPEGA